MSVSPAATVAVAEADIRRVNNRRDKNKGLRQGLHVVLETRHTPKSGSWPDNINYVRVVKTVIANNSQFSRKHLHWTLKAHRPDPDPDISPCLIEQHQRLQKHSQHAFPAHGQPVHIHVAAKHDGALRLDRTHCADVQLSEDQ